jgi:hypothetical protein
MIQALKKKILYKKNSNDNLEMVERTYKKINILF